MLLIALSSLAQAACDVTVTTTAELQDATNSVQDGDVICIDDSGGTWTDSLGYLTLIFDVAGVTITTVDGKRVPWPTAAVVTSQKLTIEHVDLGVNNIEIDRSTVTFTDLTASGGAAFALRVNGKGASLGLRDSKLTGGTGAAIIAADTGSGAPDSVVIEKSTISGYGAAAVQVDTLAGWLMISSSEFSGNKGDKGGAIYAWKSMVDIQSSTFSGNSAQTQGGAIYAYGGILNTYGCTFASNSANTGGGHLYDTLGTVSLFSTLFQGGSVSSGDGGGLHLSDLSSFTVEGSLFFENESRAGKGGAIYANSNTSNAVKTSRFCKNVAKNGGAAVYETAGDQLRLVGDVLVSNTTTSGAVVSAGAPNFSVTNVTAVGNSASALLLVTSTSSGPFGWSSNIVVGESVGVYFSTNPWNGGGGYTLWVDTPTKTNLGVVLPDTSDLTADDAGFSSSFDPDDCWTEPTLRDDSPAVDGGQTSLGPDSDGSRTDMGAYGGLEGLEPGLWPTGGDTGGDSGGDSTTPDSGGDSTVEEHSEDPDDSAEPIADLRISGGSGGCGSGGAAILLVSAGLLLGRKRR